MTRLTPRRRKLVINVAVGDLGTRVVIGSCAGLALLVVATALSVYRPRGRTPWNA